MDYWTKGSIWTLRGVHEEHGQVSVDCCLVGAVSGREEIAERLSSLVEKMAGDKFTLKSPPEFVRVTYLTMSMQEDCFLAAMERG